MTESSPEGKDTSQNGEDLVDYVDEVVPGAWNDEEHLPTGDGDEPSP